MTHPPSCLIAIFGASGDLAHRLLAPALYNLAVAGRLPEKFAVVGIARRKSSVEDFREGIVASIRESKAGDIDEAMLKKIALKFHYYSQDFASQGTYPALKEFLEKTAQAEGTGKSILFYMATPPELFTEVPRFLSEQGLLKEEQGSFRRIVFEKPFGHDLKSARALNEHLGKFMTEKQIYRIDHYLGKETVQNILAFRFGNGIFEPIWNRNHIDSVHINVAETLGVEHRAAYYDTAGALRDMVPNHLFQLLSLIGMEPPNSFGADDLRDEKVKCLRAITPFTAERLRTDVVRGQYEGYLREEGVNPVSHTETFAALKVGIDNWRWAGVPFYLRTGKRLKARLTEIVVRFKCAPLHLFKDTGTGCTSPNELTFGIQPKETISLSFSAKVPGPKISLQDVSMGFDYAKEFGRSPQTGYETLLFDAMTGEAALFQRADQTEASWEIVDPILKAWESGKGASPIVTYPVGSDGPELTQTPPPNNRTGNQETAA
jgi:glucose-6-phosphate 1-dehydrogenase